MLSHLGVIATSRLRRVQQVTTATDGIHWTTQGVHIVLVVIVTHDMLHGVHISHLCVSIDS